MKIFISSVDSYVGNVLVTVLNDVLHPEIIGTLTKSTTSLAVPKGVSQIIERGNAEALKKACMQSEVIIYDLVQDPEEAKLVLQELSENALEEEKLFLCVSTLLTWAKTPNENEQEPFAEEDFRKRKPHPNYKKQLFIEKLALKLKKPNLRTKVVCSGLQYGEGEDLLHFLFKRAWLGESLPLIGSYYAPSTEDNTNVDNDINGATNIVPMIHVRDLCFIVAAVITNKSLEDNYILAVDSSNTTLAEIVKTLSSKLGANRVHPITKEESLLLKDASQYALDFLTVNLPTEPVVANEIHTSWKCETGFIESIQHVIQEYKDTRGVTPLKIIVHGPPASGKTTLCKLIAQEYSLQYVTTEETIKEALERDPEIGKLGHDHGKDGKLSEDIIASMVRKKLLTWPCQNQGFVFDGYPTTIMQAELLFTSEEDVHTNIMPDFLVVLEASEDILKARVLDMPESDILARSYDQQGFQKKLQNFKEHNTEDQALTTFFEEKEGILPLYLQSNVASVDLLAEIRKVIGKPHNYGPSSEELSQKKKAEQNLQEELQKKAQQEKENNERSEKQERDRRESEWAAKVAKLEQEEREVLELQSAPFRLYLMDNIMPTLTTGLIEICKIRPSDPIDYLAEYLFKHSN